MTKRDLVERVSEKAGSTRWDAGNIIQRTLDAIVAALVAEGRIEFRGFGIFEVRKRSARAGRNPRTGEKVFVPEKLAVSFVPGKTTEARIRDIADASTPRSDAA